MGRDIITNKWILGAVLLLLIVAGGSYFYYAYTTAQHKKAAAELDEFVRQWEKDRQAQQKSSTETQETSTDIPAESGTPQNAEKPITDTTVTKKTETTHGQTGAAAENTETAEVRMSPHGFGPYPEIPEGFEEQVGTTIWTDIELYGPMDPDIINVRHQELMDRVLIKVWNDDPESRTYMEGAFYRNGKVYVNYSNRAYVRYKTVEFPDGTENRVITSWTAGSLKAPVPDPVNPFQSNDDQIPSGIELIDLDKEDPGIDPYSFLGL